jgi:tRNA (cmo5U34)-methyltransferase
MLAVCRRRIEERGITSRCDFHEGYLDSLPASEPFHAATSLLVSQFVLKREARVAFFRGIAERLQPGGLLASADLASDIASTEYESLLEVWLRLMKTTDVTDEQLAKIRVAYGRDVALLPLDEVKTIIVSGGFEPPVQFLQTCLIHAWWAQRTQPVA